MSEKKIWRSSKIPRCVGGECYEPFFGGWLMRFGVWKFSCKFLNSILVVVVPCVHSYSQIDIGMKTRRSKQEDVRPTFFSSSKNNTYNKLLLPPTVQMSGYSSHNPSPQDEFYMSLARNYHQKMLAPAQSNFRVIAILTYYEIQVNTSSTPPSLKHRSPLKHIIGCNGISRTFPAPSPHKTKSAQQTKNSRTVMHRRIN